MNLFDLNDDVAVVIGGTGVLGGAMAAGLAGAGAAVAVLGRNAERGEARVKSIEKEGGKAVFVSAEVNSKESLQAAHQAIVDRLGAPTILVNAAGGNDPKVTVTADLRFEQINADDWRAAFDTNLVGSVLRPCQEFGPAMCRQKRGSIVNIASVSGHIPLSRVVAYSAAKAAVLNLTQFLAHEWARFNVRVNTITPGFFPAEQNRRLLYKDDGSPTDRAKAILGHTSMGRFGRPEELVGAVLYLASEKASGFVTGADIRVDGGFLSQTI